MRRMEKDKCRFCGFILKKIFIDLGKTPLANSYLKSNQIKKPEKKFPLQVFICKTDVVKKRTGFRRMVPRLEG